MVWLALDVDYRTDPSKPVGHHEYAIVACVAFDRWSADKPTFENVHRVNDVKPYESGAFFKRELPCLLVAISNVIAAHGAGAVEGFVLDGYVWLGAGHPGLGAKLAEYLQTISLGHVPVIGVAKTEFVGAATVSAPVLRGQSKKPLWVSAEGVLLSDAANWVQGMHGAFRLPTLLQRVDALCRA